MRQLDLFSQDNPPLSPFAKGGVVQESDTPLSCPPFAKSRPTPSPGDGGDLKSLSSERLTHYRTKLAMWDRIGYHKVAQEIAEDTIHGHNELGDDMRKVASAVKQHVPLNYFRDYRAKARLRNRALSGDTK